MAMDAAVIEITCSSIIGLKYRDLLNYQGWPATVTELEIR